MYFKAGKNDKICANPVSDTLNSGLTDNFSVGWSCLRFVCVGRDRECWQDVIGTIMAPMAHSWAPRDDFNPGISEYITELSQQQPTSWNRSVNKWNAISSSEPVWARINARMRRPIVFEIWLNLTPLIIMQQRGGWSTQEQISYSDTLTVSFYLQPKYAAKRHGNNFPFPEHKAPYIH